MTAPPPLLGEEKEEEDEPPSKRRPRFAKTTFSPEEKNEMLKILLFRTYPDRATKRELATRFGKSEDAIANFFQNKRANVLRFLRTLEHEHNGEGPPPKESSLHRKLPESLEELLVSTAQPSVDGTDISLLMLASKASSSPREPSRNPIASSSRSARKSRKGSKHKRARHSEDNFPGDPMAFLPFRGGDSSELQPQQQHHHHHHHHNPLQQQQQQAQQQQPQPLQFPPTPAFPLAIPGSGGMDQQQQAFVAQGNSFHPPGFFPHMLLQSPASQQWSPYLMSPNGPFFGGSPAAFPHAHNTPYQSAVIPPSSHSNNSHEGTGMDRSGNMSTMPIPMPLSTMLGGCGPGPRMDQQQQQQPSSPSVPHHHQQPLSQNRGGGEQESPHALSSSSDQNPMMPMTPWMGAADLQRQAVMVNHFNQQHFPLQQQQLQQQQQWMQQQQDHAQEEASHVLSTMSSSSALRRHKEKPGSGRER